MKITINIPDIRFILFSHRANWEEFSAYPRFWFKKTTNPNFQHKFFNIKFLWWRLTISK